MKVLKQESRRQTVRGRGVVDAHEQGVNGVQVLGMDLKERLSYPDTVVGPCV